MERSFTLSRVAFFICVSTRECKLRYLVVQIIEVLRNKRGPLHPTRVLVNLIESFGNHAPLSVGLLQQTVNADAQLAPHFASVIQVSAVRARRRNVRNLIYIAGMSPPGLS